MLPFFFHYHITVIRLAIITASINLHTLSLQSISSKRYRFISLFVCLSVCILLPTRALISLFEQCVMCSTFTVPSLHSFPSVHNMLNLGTRCKYCVRDAVSYTPSYYTITIDILLVVQPSTAQKYKSEKASPSIKTATVMQMSVIKEICFSF